MTYHTSCWSKIPRHTITTSYTLMRWMFFVLHNARERWYKRITWPAVCQRTVMTTANSTNHTALTVFIFFLLNSAPHRNNPIPLSFQSCRFPFLSQFLAILRGRDSSVAIVTRYVLDGPGIESQWEGRDFPHPSRPALGTTLPPVQLVLCLSQG